MKNIKTLIVTGTAALAVFFAGCVSNSYRGVDLLNGEVNKAGESTERNKGAGDTELENTIIRWYIDSAPRGARVFYRVISSTSQVQNTNESYLGVTPLEETKSFDIKGLSKANAGNVRIEIKLSKQGYYDQKKAYNLQQAIDQQEISGFFELVPEE
ncbi:MAG: hypothetical protein J6K96_01245 [Treponema sp.]|nr:hypothetical protein [Treponema sp.]